VGLNANTSDIDAQEGQVIGHNESVQRGSRTPEGQALQLRVDFNTLDPLDASSGTVPTPGVHFLAFTPGSQIFHRSRRGMDDPTLSSRYHIAPSAYGINAFIRATRRQNFLVPPRRHRAFPLLELSTWGHVTPRRARPGDALLVVAEWSHEGYGVCFTAAAPLV